MANISSANSTSRLTCLVTHRLNSYVCIYSSTADTQPFMFYIKNLPTLLVCNTDHGHYLRGLWCRTLWVVTGGFEHFVFGQLTPSSIIGSSSIRCVSYHHNKSFIRFTGVTLSSLQSCFTQILAITISVSHHLARSCREALKQGTAHSTAPRIMLETLQLVKWTAARSVSFSRQVLNKCK